MWPTGWGNCSIAPRPQTRRYCGSPVGNRLSYRVREENLAKPGVQLRLIWVYCRRGLYCLVIYGSTNTGTLIIPPLKKVDSIDYFFKATKLSGFDHTEHSMKTPKRLLPLIEDGLVDEVLYPLMSGKEASVYVVRAGRDILCAKVYKDAAKRSFKQAVQYREGRKGRNSRRQRAIEKGSKFGRAQQEEEWHNAEVDALYKLSAAGVRVPEPHGCFDGVLLMELITALHRPCAWGSL